jgi:hypothetical protein
MDKSRFEHLVEKRMKNQSSEKLNLNTLLEMMERLDDLVSLSEDMNVSPDIDLSLLPQDWIDKLPKIEISERWGIGAQKPEDENAARTEFRKYMDNIEGSTVEEKLRSIESFINQSETVADATEATKQVISNIMFLELLSTVVNDFSPSGAGFLFEAFLAGLLQGTQMVEKTEGGVLDIDDLVDADNKPISLKLLVPTTPVKGSIRNLINFIALSPKAQPNGIEYICVYKYGKDKTKALGMYSFQITGDNIYYWLAKSLKFDVTLSESAISDDQFRTLLLEVDEIEIEKTKAGQLTSDQIKTLRSAQENNYKKVNAGAGGSRGYYNKSNEIRKRIKNTNASTKTAINTIIRDLQIDATYKNAAAIDASQSTQVDLSSLLDGRKALYKRINQKKSAKKVPEAKRKNAIQLFNGIDSDQRANFFFSGITKVSNKDEIVSLMTSPDGQQGLAMLNKVADDYGFPTAKAKLDVDTEAEYVALTDDEFGILLKARKKLRDDLRKSVRPDNEYLGFFKNTYTKATLAGDQPQTVEDFKSLFNGTGDYSNMKPEERRRKWANDLLDRAGLSGTSSGGEEGGEKSQFEIKSDDITKARLPDSYAKRRLGVLKIDRDQIVSAANSYAQRISTDIIQIFVQLHELSSGLTDYFLKDEINSGVRAQTALTNLDAVVQKTVKTTSEV